MRLAAILFLLASAGASAQTDTRLDFVTLGLGSGSGTRGTPSGSRFVGAAIDIRVARRQLLLQSGASLQGTLFGGDGVTEGHVLLGIANRSNSGVLTLAAGPSLSHVVRSEFDDGRYSGRTRGYAIGLHASAGAVVALLPEVGIGVEAFANVNTRTPITGVRLTAALGRLPPSVIR